MHTKASKNSMMTYKEALNKQAGLNLSRDDKTMLAGGAFLLSAGLLFGSAIYQGRKASKFLEQISAPENTVTLSRAKRAIKSRLDPRMYVAYTKDEFRKNPYGIQLPDSFLSNGNYMSIPVTPAQNKANGTGKDEWANIIWAPKTKDGRVNLSALLHELGHAKNTMTDPEAQRKRAIRPWPHQLLSDAVVGLISPDRTPLLREEISAWDNAGIAAGDTLREKALNTYRLDARLRLLRILSGIGIGASTASLA